MSGHMSVYCMYTGRIKGYTECDVYGMCTDFVYLKDSDPWFNEISFWAPNWISRGRVYGYSNLSFETDTKTKIIYLFLFAVYLT